MQKVFLEGHIFHTLEGALSKILKLKNHISKTVEEISRIPLIMSSGDHFSSYEFTLLKKNISKITLF